MSDITKCKGDSCPLREKCWRYISNASYWQSYFTEVPYNFHTGFCDQYWPLEEEEHDDGE